jgi:hypothetical protein
MLVNQALKLATSSQPRRCCDAILSPFLIVVMHMNLPAVNRFDIGAIAEREITSSAAEAA